jgi:hypothetical protein
VYFLLFFPVFAQSNLAETTPMRPPVLLLFPLTPLLPALSALFLKTAGCTPALPIPELLPRHPRSPLLQFFHVLRARPEPLGVTCHESLTLLESTLVKVYQN